MKVCLYKMVSNKIIRNIELKCWVNFLVKLLHQHVPGSVINVFATAILITWFTTILYKLLPGILLISALPFTPISRAFLVAIPSGRGEWNMNVISPQPMIWVKRECDLSSARPVSTCVDAARRRHGAGQPNLQTGKTHDTVASEPTYTGNSW